MPAFLGAAFLTALSAIQAEADRMAPLKDDPPYVAQRLRLEDLPAPTGPAVALFNGRDLDDWEAWLGYADPALTYAAPPVASLGPGGKGTMFRVVEEDGAPALYVNGETWGSLVHNRDFSDYHLSLE